MLSRIIIIISIFSSFCASGQIFIKGKILNANAKPIAFTSVNILKDYKTQRNAIADSSGNYQIVIDAAGEYIVTTQIVGYKAFIQRVNFRLDTIMNIVLMNEIKALKEVKINMIKPAIEHRIDRLVFNVENSIAATGGDALDILKITPNLQIYNDQISMVGKSGIKLMVNDRQIKLSGDDLLNYIRSIPADIISKVEIFTAPPSKYDADGNSGLVNLILKKTKRDFYNGNLSTTVTQSKHLSNNYNAGINYQKDRLAVLVNLNFGNGNSAPYQSYHIFYPSFTWEETKISKSFKERLTGFSSVDYQISRKTNVGLDYSRGVTQVKNLNDNSSLVFSPQRHLDSSIVTRSNVSHEMHSNSVNLYASSKLDTNGKTLYIDATYLTYSADINNNYNSNSHLPNGDLISEREISANNLSGQQISIYSSKIDFDLPLEKFKISFGAKMSWINNSSNILFYDTHAALATLNLEKSNKFRYFENTQAIHFSVERKMINKFEFKGSLRLENTQIKGHSFTLNRGDSYTKLFPTLFFAYPTTPKTYLTLSYSKRIERPSYTNLNPFRFYTTANNYTEGNPFLQPYFTHNVELALSTGSFYHSVYYKYQSNGIDQVTFVNENTGTQVTSPRNFFKSRAIGVSEYYSFTKIKGWQSINSLSVFHSETNSTLSGTLPSIKCWTAYFSSNNTFNINKTKTLKGEMILVSQTPYVANSYKASASYTISGGTRLLLFKKQLQLGLILNDIFKTSGITFTNVVNNIYQSKFSYYDTHQIRLSLRYSFGKSVKPNKRINSNEEEKKRISTP